jgi:hypothetical protein
MLIEFQSIDDFTEELRGVVGQTGEPIVRSCTRHRVEGDVQRIVFIAGFPWAGDLFEVQILCGTLAGDGSSPAGMLSAANDVSMTLHRSLAEAIEPLALDLRAGRYRLTQD